MPASAASFRKIASAVGERQMFPVQTNKTPNLLPDIGRPNTIESVFSAEHAPVRQILALLGAGLLALQPVIGLAQDWPRKPIRVVIPFAVGSVSEAIFRTISPGVETNLGQRFVVESKPGADGAIGTGEVVRAAPDGYTLLLGPTAVYAVTPHMFKTLGFDPLTALEPISLLADAPLLAVIGANVPAKSLKELAEYVSAQPGKFNYGSPGSGSPAHLTGAAFSQQTGNSMVYVPYKGTPPMVQALLAGDIQVAFPTLTGIIGPVKAGKLRVLAVMARQRMAELPDVPTTLEAGFPQLVGGNWWVLAAPRGTNSRIIERLAGLCCRHHTGRGAGFCIHRPRRAGADHRRTPGRGRAPPFGAGETRCEMVAVRDRRNRDRDPRARQATDRARAPRRGSLPPCKGAAGRKHRAGDGVARSPHAPEVGVRDRGISQCRHPRRRRLRRFSRRGARRAAGICAGRRSRSLLALPRLPGKFLDTRLRRPGGARNASAHGTAPRPRRSGDDRADPVRGRLLRADLPHSRARRTEQNARTRLRRLQRGSRSRHRGGSPRRQGARRCASAKRGGSPPW